MKKIYIALAALISLGAASAFADDALVMPAKVLRITGVFASSSYDQKFDSDGEKQDTTEVSMLNLGGALEYGVTGQLTAALQWAPGYTFSSSYGDDDKANVNSFNDLFIGAKYQFVGPKALLPSDTFRVAAAAGFKAPLPAPDYAEEVENMNSGDEYTVSGVDKNAWAVGARFYADWVANKFFFLNFYSEYINYFERSNVYANFTDAYIDSIYPTDSKCDFKPGYSLTLELEPHFTYEVTKTVAANFNIPVTYTITGQDEINGEADSSTDSSLLKVGPYLGAFVRTTVPFELGAQYRIPVLGANSAAVGSLVLKGKVYLKF